MRSIDTIMSEGYRPKGGTGGKNPPRGESGVTPAPPKCARVKASRLDAHELMHGACLLMFSVETLGDFDGAKRVLAAHPAVKAAYHRAFDGISDLYQEAGRIALAGRTPPRRKR